MSWPLVKLSDVCALINGRAYKQHELLSEGKYMVLRVGNFFSKKDWYYSDLELPDDKYCKHGDLLYAWSASFGPRIWEGEKVIYHYHIWKIVIDKKMIDKKYLFYALQNDIESIKRDQGTGSTMIHITKAAMEDRLIPLPPLFEQKRIAAILDKADSIRRKRQQTIQLADEFLRAVFLDMFGDPVSNSKGWEVKPLKELSVKISSGSTPKGGREVYVDKGITFFRSQNVWKNDIRLDDVAFIDEKTHESLKKSSLKHKDILMTKTGRFNTENSSLGRAALFLGEDNSANVNGHVYLIRLKEGILHEFIVYILTSNEYREHIRNVCVGGIDKRQLNKEHIEDFPIICPPHDLQIEFMKKLNVVQKIQSDATVGLKEAVALFNTLSQKAFSGEL